MQASATPAKLTALAPEFQTRLKAARNDVGKKSFSWYAYDIMGNIGFMQTLLDQAGLKFQDLVAGNPVLDIGCADGDLAFFMESMGCEVCAVDYPPMNANAMKGVRALKEALHSPLEILEVDVDRGFNPPEGKSYSLVVLLGILYHLKNPYLILETLAEHAEYCFLSTRVTRYSSDRTTSIHDLPVAFLLDRGEANNDITNYWIFSQEGLRRLVKRSGWKILATVDVGDTKTSDPVTNAGDERVYYLLQKASTFTNGRLLEGWYPMFGGANGWRWTEPAFSAEFEIPAATKSPEILLDMFVIDPHLALKGSVTITASLAGQPTVSTTLLSAAAHVWRFAVPRDVSAAGKATVHFAVNPGAPSPEDDPRAFGVIVNAIRLVEAE